MSAKAGQLATTRTCCANTKLDCIQTTASDTKNTFQFLYPNTFVFILYSLQSILAAKKAVGVSANNRRPLEKKLIPPLAFVRANTIVGVGELKPQPVKLAEVPGHIRRVADGFESRLLDAWRVIEQETCRPIFV